MEARLLHPGCTDLAWDGSVLAAGLGKLWRLAPDGAWLPEEPRPLYAVHHRGPQRGVDVVGAFVYTQGTSGWRATARRDGDHVLPHPSGAVAFARDGVVHRAARPGRTPTDIPELRLDSLRFAREGDRLLGLGVDGPVSIELSTGTATPLRGQPLGEGVLLVDGDVRRGAQVLCSGLREVSPAVGPTHIAGPGGWLWPVDGRPPVKADIALGATLPLGSGFATVPYDGREGWWIDDAGRERVRFPVSIDDDDVVTALSVSEGSLWAQTALGRELRLLDDVPASVGTGSEALRMVDTPLGPVSDALATQHGRRHWVVAESGCLLTWDA